MITTIRIITYINIIINMISTIRNITYINVIAIFICIITICRIITCISFESSVSFRCISTSSPEKRKESQE